MASLLRMPGVSADADPALLESWSVAAGDAVARGTALATVETDKALVEIEAESDAVVHTLLVEGGARAAQSFLDAGLVDRVQLFSSPVTIGKDGVASPFVGGRMPDGFSLRHTARYGADILHEYERDD